MKRLLTALALCALWACGSDPYEPRDPDPVKPTPDPEPDYSEIIADKAIRVELPSGAMVYGSPGIMYTCGNDKFSYIDLDHGARVDFNPCQPSLSIDGQPVKIESHKIIATQSGTSWHILRINHNYSESTATIVTESL